MVPFKKQKQEYLAVLSYFPGPCKFPVLVPTLLTSLVSLTTALPGVGAVHAL